VDAIPQTIVVLGSDGSVEYANRTVIDYTGLSAEDLMGPDFRPQVFHPEDMERLRETRQLGFSRGLPCENEIRVRRKDGQYRWFLIRYATGKSRGSTPTFCRDGQYLFRLTRFGDAYSLQLFLR